MRFSWIFAAFFSHLLSPVIAQALDPWDGLIEQHQRIGIIQNLCDSLKLSYAGWELKKRITLAEGYADQPQPADAQTVVADGDLICKQAMETEQKIENPFTREKLAIAQSNLAFSDRVRKLGASFKDSHLVLTRIQNATFIQLGFQMIEIQDRFYIESVNGYLQTYLGMSGKSVPRKGDEVLMFNQQNVESARASLYPYVSASTERALKTEALLLLTGRSFAYPEHGKITLEWKDQNGVRQRAEIPWIYGQYKNKGMPLHEDDAIVLKHIGAVENAAVFYREQEREIVTSENLDETEDRLSLKDQVNGVEAVYNTDNILIGKKGLLSGSRDTLWIQIRTFTNWEVLFTRPSSDSKKRFEDYLSSWLQAAAKQNLKLILDLRKNPGGDARLPAELASYLVKNTIGVTPFTRAFPLTMMNRNTLLQSFVPETKMIAARRSDSTVDLALVEEFSKQFESEKADKPFVSPLYRDKRIHSKGIFAQAPRVVVWTSEQCTSACEIAVMTLSKNNIAKIIGTTTTGTGMGNTREVFQQHDGKIVDHYQLFSSSFLPNMYFGPPSTSMSPLGLDPDRNLNTRVTRISENRPHRPDSWYEESLEDLTHNGLGWIKASALVFESMKGAE